MLAVRRSVLLPFLLLVLAARAARAEDSDAREQERRTFLARIGASGSLIQGSRMVGFGSRERFVQGGVAVIDFKVARFFSKRRYGLEVASQLMIPAEKEKSVGFGQLEFAADWMLADGPWGSLVAGIGIGGDYGRYWWEGRVYPLAILRERTWLSRKVRLEFETRTLPIAYTGKLPLFEQRFELAIGIGIFTMGLRFNWTAAWGGIPQRTYEQHELGGFLGAGF
jgi:hypothetical protein